MADTASDATGSAATTKKKNEPERGWEERLLTEGVLLKLYGVGDERAR